MAVKVRERPKNSGIYWLFIDHKGKRKAQKIGRNEKLARKSLHRTISQHIGKPLTEIGDLEVKL